MRHNDGMLKMATPIVDMTNSRNDLSTLNFKDNICIEIRISSVTLNHQIAQIFLF